MRKEIKAVMFACLVLLQVAVPVSMIVKREMTLKYGAAFTFKTAPVDPYDAFRGRYVAIRVEAEKANKTAGLELKPRQNVYAELTVDEQGMARIGQVGVVRPKGQAYLAAKVAYVDGNEVSLSLPIDRYYMEEFAAPRAERLYREQNRRGAKSAQVMVRVLDGFAVIEGLYIGGRRVEEMLRESKDR